MIDNINLREVNKIQINVVGSFNNKDEINEIETVAKVFIVAERMIDITYNIDNRKLTEKEIIHTPKKSIINANGNSTSPRYLTVKGLN